MPNVTAADYSAAAAAINNMLADNNLTQAEKDDITAKMQALGYTVSTGFFDTGSAAGGLTQNDATRMKMLMTAFRDTASAMSQTSQMNFEGLDVDSIMMMVQCERARLLDAQIVQRTQKIKDRSTQIQQLNTMQAQVRAMAATFGTDAKPTDTVAVPGTLKDSVAAYNAFAGLGGSGSKLTTSVGTTMAKKDVEALQEEIKAAIDSLNSTQQMEMTDLQSLTNKRNEAYETVTNFISKIQKTKDAVVGNMR